jgi:hypothetical protein
MLLLYVAVMNASTTSWGPAPSHKGLPHRAVKTVLTAQKGILLPNDRVTAMSPANAAGCSVSSQCFGHRWVGMGCEDPAARVRPCTWSSVVRLMVAVWYEVCDRHTHHT